MSTLSVSAIQNTASPVTNVVLNADGSSTVALYNAAVAPTPVQTGTLWYDASGIVTGDSTVLIWDGAAWVGTIGATAATLAEAATGVITTKYLSPETGVPKDAAGMTGAAILPSGTTVQQPTVPAVGMLRVNTDYPVDTVEAYDGVTASWRPLQYGANLGVLPDLIVSTNGPLPSAGTYENITINAGVTATVSGLSQLYARTSITINGTINADFRGYQGGTGASSGFLGNPVGMGVGNTGGGQAGNRYGFTALLSSSGTGGQVSGDGINIAGTNAGAAGGSVVLVTDGTLTLGASAVITAKGSGAGASFSSGNSSVGGGGGGAGGLILLQSYKSITAAAGSQLNVSGGNGSNGVKSGTGIDVGGGGGGGGGYIVLNAPSITDSSTKNFAGGLPGANTGVLATSGNGGGGAGFGGSGGTGGLPGGIAPAAGSAGQVLLNAYI